VAQEAFDEADYRWAAEVLDHVIFDDPGNAEACSLQAQTFEQIGYGCENGTWRSAFLTGAQELRQGITPTPISTGAPDIVGALSVAQVFDTIAIRVDGPRAWEHHLLISWVISDDGAIHVTELRNGVLVRRVANAPAEGGTTFTLTRPTLIGLVTGAVDLVAAIGDGRVGVDGDPGVLATLVGLLVAPDPNFAVVTP
jgi:alkyl sulfatase BDS1-like metallo-beta-lactamase superfamily hydrolase